MPIQEFEYNDDLAHANIFDASITGSLGSYSDVDWFKFNNPYPTSLNVNFSVASKGVWSVQLYDQNMQVLSGRNIDASLNYTVPGYSVGDYTIRVQTTLPGGVMYSGGAYTITVDRATYNVRSLSSSYDEGSSALFEVTRTGNDNNYSIYYKLTGPGADSQDGIVVGKIPAFVNNKCIISVPLENDGKTEGNEILNLSLGMYSGGVGNFISSYAPITGATASVLVIDTSKDNANTINYITGTVNNDTLQGTSANDYISGNEGDDTLIGGPGNDRLDGGYGVDTAQYSGPYSNFTVTALYEGKNGDFSGYQVKDNTGAEGTDSIPVTTVYNISTNIEYLTFNKNQTKVLLGSSGSISVVSNSTRTNNTPTGSVMVSGTTKSGQVLTASNSLSDSDGLGSITYQWQSSSDGNTWSDLTTGSTITLSNAVVGLRLRVTATYIDLLGTKESIYSTTTDAIQSGANVINGTAGNDNLVGTSTVDMISAGAGNDLITGSVGNDTIDGGTGVDTLTYSGTYATFSVANGANGVLTLASSKFGSDSVINVERFKFSDKCFANDVSGSAGNAAKAITAAFGKAYVPQFLAIGLTLADSGQSIDNLCETVTNAKLVESISGDSSTNGYVAAVFKNVVGRAPNLLESNSFVSMIDSGSISRLGLLELAAKHSMVSDTVNSLNVELLGIPYDPGF